MIQRWKEILGRAARRVFGAAAVVTMACGRGETAASGRSERPVDSADSVRAAAAAAAAAAATATAAARPPAVVFLGTSLTAGLGLDRSQAYPALIQQKIDSAGLRYRVVNAGVSGETSAGSRRQAEWLLAREPAAVLVIETGANDGLRGLDVDSLRANIGAIITGARATQPDIRIVLVGMEAPPNLGRGYTGRFREVYRGLAAQHGVPLVPFLLTGVAGIDSLNQADGVHPTAAGQRMMAETVWGVLGPVLRGAVSESR